ncbi:6-bladed beta-propeller [Bacteroides muris (ex Afrizal et al. 2022)]|jgi:hypothetical protein|uniref:6-bladed beta-propeller n=1 Tax=Bacteroides muris (ex Afrizal et al. 2022) TaxID=2516960 RepID=A0A4V3RC30_9BACE|nr:6-bladed beta-propeller [Bacteroides muris (ex Afrizal et al. 2022)]TGY06890.1 6-bladed beta-propeller [Bacteroides muris (ex Afrizal et al. 2022)]
MYKVVFGCLVVFFCLWGCVNKYDSIIDTDAACITVNPNNSEKLDIEAIFSSIEVTALESSEASLFGKCDKMLFKEGKYYILDRKEACIYVFNANGTFLRNSKSKQGDGPGEYHCIVDFDISKDKHIEILDVSAYKIMIYDDEFNFLDEVEIPKDLYPISTFKCLNNELYAFYSSFSSTSNANDRMNIYSFKQNRIVESTKGYIYIPSLRIGVTQPYSFYESEGDVFFSFPYPNDKVYKIEKNEGHIKEVIRYNFGSCSFPFEKIDSHKAIFEDIIKGSGKYAFPICRWENKNFLFTFIMYQEKQHLLLYKKDSERSNLYSCTFNNGELLLPPIYVDNDFLYVIAEPSWLEYLVSKKLLVETATIDTINNIKEDDNSVILKYRLKK